MIQAMDVGGLEDQFQDRQVVDRRDFGGRPSWCAAARLVSSVGESIMLVLTFPMTRDPIGLISLDDGPSRTLADGGEDAEGDQAAEDVGERGTSGILRGGVFLGDGVVGVFFPLGERVCRGGASQGRGWSRRGRFSRISSLALPNRFRTFRGVWRSHGQPFVERSNALAEGFAGHGDRFPGRSARAEVFDVVVEADGPKTIESVAKFERSLAARQAEARQRLGVYEREQGENRVRRSLANATSRRDRRSSPSSPKVADRSRLCRACL